MVGLSRCTSSMSSRSQRTSFCRVSFYSAATSFSAASLSSWPVSSYSYRANKQWRRDSLAKGKKEQLAIARNEILACRNFVSQRCSFKIHNLGLKISNFKENS